MTEFCIPNTIKDNEKSKSSIFNSNNIFTFILSYPLYFSYLIFFFPYLFKLFFFLSPLIFTTFLLILSITATFIPLNTLLNSKDGFFLTVYTTLLETFHPSFDDEDKYKKLLGMEEFELYKFVFDVSTIELNEANPSEDDEFGENPSEVSCDITQIEERTSVQSESLAIEQETRDTSPKKEQYLGSFRSMKIEKEYRKTLACMLFEERHNWSNKNINLDNSNSEDGMDLLWEIDETEKNRGNLKEEEEEDQTKKFGKKITNKFQNSKKNDYKDDQSEDSDDYDNGKICCLQAFKLSAGKMNISMGRSSLVKFKGIRWLHNHVRRQGNKGYK